MISEIKKLWRIFTNTPQKGDIVLVKRFQCNLEIECYYLIVGSGSVNNEIIYKVRPLSKTLYDKLPEINTIYKHQIEEISTIFTIKNKIKEF